MQCASIVPILFLLLDKFCARPLPKVALIVASLTLLPLAVLLLGLFNERGQVWVAGRPRSLLFFLGVFCMGAVAILSDLLFLPYMKRLPARYFKAYFVGTGLSGALPSLLSILQGGQPFDFWLSLIHSSFIKQQKMPSK